MADANANGERMINVPGKGQVTESQFRTMIQNGDLAAGPSGSAMNDALNSGSYKDPYSSGQQSGSNTASGSNESATMAANMNPSTNSSSGFGAVGGGLGGSSSYGQPGGARTENVYALRPNDDPTSWSKRVFAQGTADYGPKSLNPYLSQNPLANSPFASWYQQRYGTSAPTNALVAAELSGQSPTADYTNNAMQTAAGGGNMGPANMQGAQSNLQGLNNMVTQQANGGGSLNPTQRLFAGQLLNDPQLASQAITSQLQGSTGGWGMGFLGNELSNLATQYYNDPANRGPQGPNGSFLNQALKQMGMA